MKKILLQQAYQKYSTESIKMVGPYINCMTPTDYLCKCGKIFQTKPIYVSTKHVQSCGCYKSKLLHDRNISKINTVFDKTQYKIFNGLMISDGSLSLRQIYPHFILSTITKDFITNILNTLNLQWRPLYIRSAYCKKGINAKEAYYLYSSSDISLLKEYHRWYKFNDELQKIVKIVPQDLEISPLMLKYWFYGDGSTSYTKRYKGLRLKLYTNSFTYNECLILQSKLKIVGLEFNINKDGNKITPKNKNRGFILTTDKIKNIQQFFNYIGECGIEGFKYKFKSIQ